MEKHCGIWGNAYPTQDASVPSSALVNISYYPGKQPRKFKVIVIGNSNVGKTTLTYRFCEGKFLEIPNATIVDSKSKTLDIEGERITLQLWDTAGQERFQTSMVRHFYKNANAIVFVYDVTDAESFDGLKKWIDETYDNCPNAANLPKILIGNKCDEPSVVTKNDAQRLADQHNMPFFETSAKLDSQYTEVEAIFITLAFKLKNNKTFKQPALTYPYNQPALPYSSNQPALTYGYNQPALAHSFNQPAISNALTDSSTDFPIYPTVRLRDTLKEPVPKEKFGCCS